MNAGQAGGCAFSGNFLSSKVVQPKRRCLAPPTSPYQDPMRRVRLSGSWHKIKSTNQRRRNVEILYQKLPKFQTQRETAFVTQRTVDWQDLDSQEYVNNANYAAFAEDAITTALAVVGWTPAHFKTHGIGIVNQRVHIQYLSSASWGERLEVIPYLVELKLTGGVWFIEMERTTDRASIAQCKIEWSLANRIGGEQQILPENLYRVLKDRLAIAENNAS